MTQDQTTSAVEASFLRWFRRSGGSLDGRCRIQPIQGMGRGMVATSPIKAGETLFVIPRHLLLNLSTSTLSQSIQESGDVQGQEQWKRICEMGWIPLILAMMWEQRRAHSSSPDADVSMDDSNAADEAQGQAYRDQPRPHGDQTWGPYFDIMPSEFSTPMFWLAEDLEALKGTSIADKIARDEVEADYHNMVLPFVKSLPAVFGEDVEKWYSLDTYHIMGSRILSRSFHVKSRKAGKDGGVVSMDADDNSDDSEGEGEVLEEEQEGADEAEPQDDEAGDESRITTQTQSDGEGDSDSDSDDDDEEEDAEQVSDISMTPMADMLNARFESDNARLFYRSHVLEMRATKDIAEGAQIFNTYADPPNSDLLRRYGHVDEPNGSDIVEMDAKVIVRAATQVVSSQLGKDAAEVQKDMEERLAWACESLGIDEGFAFSYLFGPGKEAPHRPQPERPTPKQLKQAATGGGIEEEMVALARILSMSRSAYEKAKAKGKGPSARIEATEELETAKGKKVSLPIVKVLMEAIDLRLADLPAIDEEPLLYGSQQSNVPNANQRLALVVRLGERRVLLDQKRAMQYVLDRTLEATKSSGGAKRAQESKGGPAKKRR